MKTASSYKLTVTHSAKLHNVRVVGGTAIRNWGGWYRHDVVELETGTDQWTPIGRIQVRRRNGRVESITLNEKSACVLGTDVRWLVTDHFSVAA